MRLLDWWRVRPFFDAAFYLERYPDVRKAGMNPLRHYLRHGAAEGRKPQRLFEPAYYLSGCAEASGNPLVHFIKTGGRLGNPHPLFDCQAYLAAHPGVGMNPLLHYLRQGRARGLGADQGVRPTFGLEILDVRVNVALWEDPEGGLRFICEPQQAPFFRAMRFDQLAAQIRP